MSKEYQFTLQQIFVSVRFQSPTTFTVFRVWTVLTFLPHGNPYWQDRKYSVLPMPRPLPSYQIKCIYLNLQSDLSNQISRILPQVSWYQSVCAQHRKSISIFKMNKTAIRISFNSNHPNICGKVYICFVTAPPVRRNSNHSPAVFSVLVWKF